LELREKLENSFLKTRSVSSHDPLLSDPDRVARRREGAELIWKDLLEFAPESELQRIRKLLLVWCGGARPECRKNQEAIGLFLPDLPSRPWFDPKDFPFIPELESNCSNLKNELDSYLKTGGEFVPYLEQPAIGEVRWARAWNKVVICTRNRTVQPKSSFPILWRILREIRIEFGFIGQCSFLLLRPGGHIPPHADTFNYLVSVHLGVQIPRGAELRVGSVVRQLQQGKCIAFDNSYRHEASNPTKEDRVVLAVHLFHPGLSAIERDVLRILHLRIGLRAV
jgi:aspartate beta-hydroxylase